MTAWTTLFSHFGLDAILYSILMCIVYETQTLGYRFSRLGHTNDIKPKLRQDLMKDIIELVRLQLENEE